MRATARWAASTAEEPIGAVVGRTPGPSGKTTASIPGGVCAATYSCSADARTSGPEISGVD